MSTTELRDELINDPLSRGYSGMTDFVAAANLNAATRTRNVAEVRSADIFEALDGAEFQALSAAATARIDRLLGLGEGIRVQSSKARSELLAAFGVGTNTRTNLAALQTVPITRAVELGIIATEYTVARARSL